MTLRLGLYATHREIVAARYVAELATDRLRAALAELDAIDAKGGG